MVTAIQETVFHRQEFDVALMDEDLATGRLPKIVQTSVITFPTLGRVIVQAIETIGESPRIAFISAKSRKTLLLQEIRDVKDLFLPVANDDGSFGPHIRYRVLHDTGLNSPVVMSVVMCRGGSDNGYYLSLFTEVNGRIVDLTPKPHGNNIQGGWYFGYLGRRFGYGLVDWGFIWGNSKDEWHYSRHRYSFEIDTVRGSHLVRIHLGESKRKYGPDDGYKSLWEIGLHVRDQRRGMPVIGEDLGEIGPPD